MQGFPPGVPAHNPTVTDPLPPTRDDRSMPRAIMDGRYRIERVIGEGTFGRVYLAFDTRLKNYVAVKELLATRNTTDHATYQRSLERFEREARAVFALQHPNVVTVYEMHQDTTGNHYLVMEHVDGLSLRELLAQVGTLSVERTVAIAIDLAAALAAISERGIVHRDFKPANIMINRRGVAKLADFGVALIPSETVTRPLGVGHPGSPVYMSPEQESGGVPVDGRSDLYSLGLVMYEMLVGRRYTDVRQPLNVVRPDVPQPLTNIVNELLQPQVAWRYQSAQEVLHDLKQLSAAPDAPPVPPQPVPPQPPVVYPPLPPPQPPRQPSKRWRIPVFGGGSLAIALVAVLLVVHVLPGPAPTPTATPTRAATVAPTSTRVPATAPATATSIASTATPVPATATRAPTSTPVPPTPTTIPTTAPTNTPVRPTNTPTISRTPIGNAPAADWKTYFGTSRAPFAIYYPPNWTVDESGLAKDGSVQFKGPNSAPILSISVNTTRTTTSIDTLRDDQAKSLTQICVRAGVEGTDRVTLSDNVIFDDLLEVCDPPQQGQQLVWLIGAGLNNGYPWYFDGLSYRKDFNKNTCNCPAGNLEAYFVPMLNSMRIYGNPAA